MAQFLDLAKEHLSKLEYVIEDPILDSEGCKLGWYVSYRNHRSILLAVESFNPKKGIGITKSIDVELTNTAIANGWFLLLYVHEPTKEHKEPEVYQIPPMHIIWWAGNNEFPVTTFTKYEVCEERKKFDNVPLAQIGIKNIRADRSRPMNKGEQYWEPYLKPLGYIYIGAQFNELLFKEAIGYTPDFININRRLIIEEGIHQKKEEERRQALAKEHKFEIYFIPFDYHYYMEHPTERDKILGIIKTLTKTIQSTL